MDAPPAMLDGVVGHTRRRKRGDCVAEVGGAVRGVEANQIVVEETIQQLLCLGQQAEQIGARERDVEEEA